MKVTLFLFFATLSSLQATAVAAICGARGYDTGINAYEAGGPYSNAYLACSGYCQKQPSCKSFASSDRECLLYDVPVSGNFEADNDSLYTFYDVSCVKPSSSSTTSTTKTAAATTATSTTLTKVSTSTSTSTTSSRATTTSSTTTASSPRPMTTTTTTSKPMNQPSTSTTSATSTCPIDARPSCTGGTFRDPCSLNCGCTYAEGCGGSIRPSAPDSVLFHLTDVSYSTCVRACDTRQPECIGVNYSPNGECYAYRSSAGTGPAQGAWFALRQSCEGACGHASS